MTERDLLLNYYAGLSEASGRVLNAILKGLINQLCDQCGGPKPGVAELVVARAMTRAYWTSQVRVVVTLSEQLKTSPTSPPDALLSAMEKTQKDVQLFSEMDAFLSEKLLDMGEEAREAQLSGIDREAMQKIMRDALNGKNLEKPT